MKELFSCLEIDAILVGGGRTKFIQNQQQPFEGRGKKRQSLKKKKEYHVQYLCYQVVC